MNKKLQKVFRNIAKQLPAGIEAIPHATQVRGSVILASGKKTLTDGTTVEPDKMYYNNKPFKAINHYQKLKKFFKRYGPKNYLAEYMKWFDQNQAEMIRKHPEMFKDYGRQTKA